jgi:hypothetical protein
MFASRRSQLWFLALNGLGIAVFLFLGSRLWVDRRVTDVPVAELGKYLGWEVMSSLLFLVAIAAGLTGLFVAMRKPGWQARARSAILVTAVTGCWLAAIWFDSAHRVID